MNQTFQNSAQVISMGIFFTLLIVGLASTLPHALTTGLEAHGVATAKAHEVGQTPPISVLFAAFLGVQPDRTPGRRLGPCTNCRSTPRRR